MQQQNSAWWCGAALALGAGLMGLASPAQAQPAWPAKPIRLLVGAPPGGSADSLARLLAEGLQRSRSGKSLLANDIHQPIGVPSAWSYVQKIGRASCRERV